MLVPRHGGIKIIAIVPDSLAETAGISRGDKLLEINGEAVLDHLNYQFLVSQRDFTEVMVEKPNGNLLRVELENGGDALGISLAQDKIKVCRQNCVFCFVHQMPQGFRKSLYLKDEDIRLSFLYGHFTTLSNSDNDELNRIIREGLSPIHVSVHATDPAARARVVGNTKHGDILSKIDHLIDGGIEIHTQVVIAPGFNDGEIWERTVTNLWERRACQTSGSGNGRGGILSLSCIPVGLTGHRQNLPLVQEIDSDYAAKWVNRWKKEARCFAKAWNGEPWLLLADEWFTRAGLTLPGRNFYSSDWTQIENGVGLIRRFQEHSRRFIKSVRAKDFAGLRLLLLTGSSFAPYLSQTIELLKQYVDSKIKVAAVPNRAFGTSVTVAGLLCGHDLLESAQKHKFFADGSTVDAVVIPSASVRAMPDSSGHAKPADIYQFLDDTTVSEMQSKLKLPVILSGDNLSQMLFNIADSTQ
ncbi:MAG: DUF512 domain-containing protein [Holophagales bacterium]|jgi:putative radical SAM enzyme (TIGR03279 family)|nr:DUF512 domain-containing protein [Holophagales bacterium]